MRPAGWVSPALEEHAQPQAGVPSAGFQAPHRPALQEARGRPDRTSRSLRPGPNAEESAGLPARLGEPQLTLAAGHISAP